MSATTVSVLVTRVRVGYIAIMVGGYAAAKGHPWPSDGYAYWWRPTKRWARDVASRAWQRDGDRVVTWVPITVEYVAPPPEAKVTV